MKVECLPHLNVSVIVLMGAVLASGCDSSMISSEFASEPATETISRSPLMVQQFDSSLQKRAANNRFSLVNGDFTQPLGNLPGWSACRDNNALSQYIDPGDQPGGNAADRRFISNVSVGPEECILQVVDINPGHRHALSCFVSTADTRQRSAMAISYYDDALNLLEVSDVAVADTSYLSRKAVTARAPAKTDIALAWFYTQAGGEIADCEFQRLRGAEPEKKHYRKTVNVERQFLAGSSFATFEGFVFNGFTELQTYPFNTIEKTLVDGFESGDPRRNTAISVGVTEDHLHVAVSVNKHYAGPNGNIPAELFTDSYPVSGDLWNDDSFEIYFNTGNEAGTGYDKNDFVRIYGYDRGFDYEPVTVTGMNSQLDLSNEAVCYVEGAGGLITCEVRFSLEELGIKGKPVAEIGFDVHVNADDDGGDREAKYSWCGGHTISVWRDMSVLDCSLRIYQ